MEGREAEVKTGHGKGEREKTYDEWPVNMLGSQHSMAMAGRVGVGIPASRWQAGVRRGRAPAPCSTATGIRFYLISLGKSQQAFLRTWLRQQKAPRGPLQQQRTSPQMPNIRQPSKSKQPSTMPMSIPMCATPGERNKD